MNSCKTSIIWNHFQQVNSTHVQCNYCTQLISASSAKNLIKHIKSKHVGISIHQTTKILTTLEQPEDCTANFTMSTPPSQTAVTRRKTAQNTTNNKRNKKKNNDNELVQYTTTTKTLSISKIREINKQLIKMIVTEYYSLRIVDGEGFKEFIHLLCPEYNLPTRKAISKILLPQIYSETKLVVKNEINAAEFLCISIEDWASPVNEEFEETFVAITAHFINTNCEYRSYSIGCLSFTETCNFNEMLVALFEEWGIENKIVAIITNKTTSSINAAIQCKWPHLKCFAHSINAIVLAGLNEIQPTIKKINDTIKFFNENTSVFEQFNQILEEMNVSKIKLKQNHPSRWNTTYAMLTNILKVKPAIVSTLLIIDQDMINNHDWDVIEAAVEVLCVFNQVALEMNLSLSKALIFVQSLKCHVMKFLYKGPLILDEIHRMADTIFEQLNIHFNNINTDPLTTQAAILDPRFKTCAFINDNDVAEAACETLKQLVCSIELKTSDDDNRPNRDSNNDDSSILSKFWKKFDEEVKMSNALLNSSSAGLIEFERYLEEPLLPRLQDPLVWWKQRRLIYPRLYEIVKQRLCIVPTAVSFERILSKAEQLAMERRSSLSATKVVQYVFLAHNLE